MAHPVIVSDETLAKVDEMLTDYIEAERNGGDPGNLRRAARARRIRHQVKIRRLEARRKTDWGRRMGVTGV